MASSAAIEQIKTDEGKRPQGYTGPRGKLHIGYGFNLTRRDAREVLILAGVRPDRVSDVMKVKGQALTEEQQQALLNITLQEAERNASNQFHNWSTIPQTIRDVLTNMSFQLGPESLRGFTEMKKAVENEDWDGMRREMLNSIWAKEQTPKRAKRLEKQVATVKFTPIPAPISKSAIASAFKADKAFKADVHEQQVQTLAGIMSRDVLVGNIANLMSKTQKADEEALQAGLKKEAASLEPKPQLAKADTNNETKPKVEETS